jgi:hypothetical protein
MKGVDLRTVQELMGHKAMAMTLRYSHLSPGHQLEAVQRLNAAPTDTRTDTDGQPVQAVAGPKAEIVDGPWTSERARPDSNGGPAGSKPVRDRRRRRGLTGLCVRRRGLVPGGRFALLLQRSIVFDGQPAPRTGTDSRHQQTVKF